MAAVVVVATLQPKPGERQFLIDAFATVAPRVHAEDEGCLLYALHDAGEPDGPLIIIEKWTSAESLAKHGRSPAMLELGSAFAGDWQRPQSWCVRRQSPSRDARASSDDSRCVAMLERSDRHVLIFIESRM